MRYRFICTANPAHRITRPTPAEACPVYVEGEPCTGHLRAAKGTREVLGCSSL